MNRFELWKLFFEAHPILDVKTTFQQQKSHCVNFRRKHIKKESCNGYFGDKEQKAMFRVVSDKCILDLRGPFNYVPDWVRKLTE